MFTTFKNNKLKILMTGKLFREGTLSYMRSFKVLVIRSYFKNLPASILGGYVSECRVVTIDVCETSKILDCLLNASMYKPITLEDTGFI